MMRTSFIPLVWIFGLAGIAVSTVQAAGDAWRIGTPDRDYRDLAAAHGVNGYLQAFPQDVRFTVGRSDPARDFSFIHPGPADAWAGSRSHPFEIAFDLGGPPQGTYAFTIHLVDTHAEQPPVLVLDINGRAVRRELERGTGDFSLMDPARGKARTMSFLLDASELRPQGNRIRLEVARGSWILYDALTFSPLAAAEVPPIELQVRPTIYFVEREGRLKQELRATLTGITGAAPVTATVHAGVDLLERAELGPPEFGSLAATLYVEETDRPRQLTVTLEAGGRTHTASLTQEPVKKWRIYVAPAVHTDIGYTNIQSRVIADHNRNTDLSLETAEAFPLWHFNLESSWAAQMWLRDRPAHRHERFYDQVRRGRLGVETGYLNMLTGLCTEEELIRNLYYTARLHREHGLPFASFTLTDAPSHVWSLPSILAGAGLRCVSVGVNGIRAPLLKSNIHHKCPFWWEGPDGRRVLTWFSPGYAQAGRIGLRHALADMQTAVEADLHWWNTRTDYPYDAILLHGAYGDNERIGQEIARAVTEYSRVYAYPKVILCSNDAFFRYIEENFADRIPTVRGCGGSWWEDGAASSALETAVNRATHQEVIAAEAAWGALGALGLVAPADHPRDRFDAVWDDVLLYDEHTWGAHNSITQPTLDFVQRQWAVKAQYAARAADGCRRLLDEALLRLAASVRAEEGSVLVFNPSGAARTGPVEVDIPRGSVIVGLQGPVPQQVVREDLLKDVAVAFLAEDVPPVGYRVYRVIAGADAPAAPPSRFDGQVLENDFYRVAFDPATGAVASLRDKLLDRELVDASSPYRFAQPIYVSGGEEKPGETQWDCPNPNKLKIHLPVEGVVQRGAAGPLFSSVRTGCRLEMFDRVETDVVLYERLRRVDVILRLHKRMTFDKEAFYVAFPVAGADPQFRYEIGGASVRPNADQMPGACRDWFAVQRWVTVSTGDAAVAWSPLDTPLATFCQMTPGNWLAELPITNGTIFAYAMNNYWFTNYKAGQDGEFVFRFCLTSDRAIDPQAASHFGESAAAPMRAVVVPPASVERTLPPEGSLVAVEPEQVALTAFKRADDGRGLIVRVRELTGRDARVAIRTSIPGLKGARRCDLVERDGDALPLADGRVELPLSGNAMATVRLE